MSKKRGGPWATVTPELQALNLGQPVAQYTGTTPYGWFVFGALLLVPLGYSLAQGIETPVEYGIAGAGFAAAAMGVRKVRRKKAWRATFFTGGLHVRQDKRVFTCRWNEVTAVLAAVTISGATKLHRYTVWRNAEESIVIEDGWEDVDDLGQRLVREANGAMLPRYAESFEAGVALKFGNLLVNRDGVGVGNAFLPWHHVTHFALSDGMVEVRGGAVREQQAVADTPNVPVLLALADGARRRVTRVE